jgi:transcriptional regulator with XRE-family HTH domain
MRNSGRCRRTTATQRAANDRAQYLARRIGTSLREARRALGLHQVDVAARAGIAQPHVSRLERGLEAAVPLTTLAACADAVDVQLAAFIEARPGADLPRDIEHLRLQSLLIAAAARGGWTAEPEAIVAEETVHPRSIDVLLTRPMHRECAVVEIWTLLADVGAAIRGLDAKLAAIHRRLGEGWSVAPLLLVRGTQRNRQIVRDFAPVFSARYPASSARWLRALTEPSARMPPSGGFMWASVRGTALLVARIG